MHEICTKGVLSLFSPSLRSLANTSRGDRIRTCDLVLPKHPRYQAAPRPVKTNNRAFHCSWGKKGLSFVPKSCQRFSYHKITFGWIMNCDPMFNKLIKWELSRERVLAVVFNEVMEIKRKRLSKLTGSENTSSHNETNDLNWYVDIEGSGQRKRYLRSLKKEEAA